eukprot:SAG31_NODE_30769_length_376_cov_0.931408_1_plen_25_part_10
MEIGMEVPFSAQLAARRHSGLPTRH